MPVTTLPVKIVKVFPIAGTKPLNQLDVESSVQARTICDHELAVLIEHSPAEIANFSPGSLGALQFG
jgi:hypothetical protein